jgi:hypothetical protein
MPVKSSLLLLLILLTGCEHTMGSAGFVGMAIHKDMTKAQRKCDMPTDKWLRLCQKRDDGKISPKCPEECQPSK